VKHPTPHAEAALAAWKKLLRALAGLAILAACGGKIPETRFYQLAPPPASSSAAGDLTIALESSPPLRNAPTGTSLRMCSVTASSRSARSSEVKTCRSGSRHARDERDPGHADDLRP